MHDNEEFTKQFIDQVKALYPQASYFSGKVERVRPVEDTTNTELIA